MAEEQACNSYCMYTYQVPKCRRIMVDKRRGDMVRVDIVLVYSLYRVPSSHESGPGVSDGFPCLLERGVEKRHCNAVLESGIVLQFSRQNLLIVSDPENGIKYGAAVSIAYRCAVFSSSSAGPICDFIRKQHYVCH